jgi:hypothetical protein
MSLPKTGVHLVHQSGTITGEYNDYIRTLANDPALRDKVQAKYQSSELTMGMINCTAHGKAFKTHCTSKERISNSYTIASLRTPLYSMNSTPDVDNAPSVNTPKKIGPMSQ